MHADINRWCSINEQSYMSTWYILMNSQEGTPHNQTYMLHILIFYLILTQMANWQVHYMTNAMSLTLQSSIVIFYEVIYYFHLLMMRTFVSSFDMQTLMLQGYNEPRMPPVCKFYGCYIDLIYDYKFSRAHMLNDLFHTLI
jgi:hypothetical protein